MCSATELGGANQAAADGVPEADVVILGASFAGIEVLYQVLRRSGTRPWRIVVVDRQDRHGYLPLVHERLLGALPDGELATADFCRWNPNVQFVHDEVVGFEPDDRRVVLASGQTLRGRVVVVALGSWVVPPPDLPGCEHILPYKFRSEFDALAERIAKLRQRPEGARVVVVGGGISGVELAAELAAARASAAGPFDVTLVAGRELLAEHGQRVRARVGAALEQLEVEVRRPARVISAHEGGVEIEEQLEGGPTQTVFVQSDLAVWAGGLQPPTVLATLGLPRTESGWLAVGPTLQCFPKAAGPTRAIFACGDAVRIVGGRGQWPTMQRAIECLWQAQRVAHNAVRMLEQGGSSATLAPHKLRRTFFYGISLGPRSLIVYRDFIFELSAANRWFRRWLMRRYFARYAPLQAALPPAPR